MGVGMGIAWTRRHLRRLSLAAAVVLLVTMVAGWKLHHWTDPADVPPIEMPAGLALQRGDIVLAGGVSLQSRSVMALTGGQRYSHVGLIDIADDGVFVIHASPRGVGDGGVGERVARLPLETFLSGRGYVRVQVLRLDPSYRDADGVREAAMGFARFAADEARPFDHRYDLREHDSLYCSELVWLAYQEAGLDWGDAIYSHLTLTTVDGPVILPDSFTRSVHFLPLWHSPDREKGPL